MEVIDRNKKNSIVADYDLEQKEAIRNLNKEIDLFIQEKKTMSPLTKWEAFYELHGKYEHMISREVLIERINKKIRKLAQDNE